MEKAKVVRFIDLNRTHQKCHRGMSYENTNRPLCQLLRKYRTPDNNLHWLGTATVPGLWPWLSNHIRTPFKSHMVKGQWAAHACLWFELSPSKLSKILSTCNTNASSWCFLWGYNCVRHSLFHSCPERSSLHPRVWAAWQCRDTVSKARSVVKADLLKAIFKPLSCLSQHFATSEERTLTWETLKETAGKTQFHLPSKLPLHQLPLTIRVPH